MSETQPAPDWWLASDGRWYPPSSRPAAEAAPSNRISNGLAWTAAAFLWLSGALSLGSAVAYFAQAAAFNRWVDSQSFDDLVTWADAHDATGALSALGLVAGIVAAVLFIIWMFQAARRAASVGADERKWSPGWAIGGWFIPFANAVIPKLVINEIDKVSRAAEGHRPVGTAWRDVRCLLISHFWWGLWILSIVVSFVGALMSGAEVTNVDTSVVLADVDVDLYRGGLILLGVGGLLAAAGAVLGGLTLRAITSRS